MKHLLINTLLICTWFFWCVCVVSVHATQQPGRSKGVRRRRKYTSRGEENIQTWLFTHSLMGFSPPFSDVELSTRSSLDKNSCENISLLLTLLLENESVVVWENLIRTSFTETRGGLLFTAKYHLITDNMWHLIMIVSMHIYKTVYEVTQTRKVFNHW